MDSFDPGEPMPVTIRFKMLCWIVGIVLAWLVLGGAGWLAMRVLA